jgi:hypothetical protein
MKKYAKVGMIIEPDLMSFPATLSPQIHHNLPRKNHVLHTGNRKTPSKNTLHQARKYYKIYRARS